MEKIKVALLEDNELLLNDLKRDLEESGLVTVVEKATSSVEFITKVAGKPIDALLLDIDLGSDSMTGLDVANRLQLPVLFVSGKTRDFLDGIETLNGSFSSAVEHISKPITQDKLKKILPKFINAVRIEQESNYIRLDFGDSKQNKISILSIVYIESATGKSGESNNKTIYFVDRKPETLCNFSFSKMGENLLGKALIKPHRSFRVSANKIKCYNQANHEIEVEVINEQNKMETRRIPVAENYRKSTLQHLSK